jgi:hypothetical protein
MLHLRAIPAPIKADRLLLVGVMGYMTVSVVLPSSGCDHYDEPIVTRRSASGRLAGSLARWQAFQLQSLKEARMSYSS